MHLFLLCVFDAWALLLGLYGTYFYKVPSALLSTPARLRSEVDHHRRWDLWLLWFHLYASCIVWSSRHPLGQRWAVDGAGQCLVGPNGDKIYGIPTNATTVSSLISAARLSAPACSPIKRDATPTHDHADVTPLSARQALEIDLIKRTTLTFGVVGESERSERECAGSRSTAARTSGSAVC